MINLPTAKDFYNSGKELINLSWDIVAKLLTNLHDSEEYYGQFLKESSKEAKKNEEISDEAERLSKKYWSASKRHLTTALSITQQGVEFILKGKIAEISPYLLIADDPSKWPSPYKQFPINFSDFKTIDAQDLIRVIDTFSDKPLDKEFREQFMALREKRNRIMHSVDKRITVSVTEVIESILFLHKSLFPEDSWPSVRLAFIKSAPDSNLYDDDNGSSINQICKEMYLTIDLMSPSQVKKYFKIDKKQRRYFCPECKYLADRHEDFDYKLAVLKPKGIESEKLYCPICEAIYDVYRHDCKAECPGNVIALDGTCLTCGEDQTDDVGSSKNTLFSEKTKRVNNTIKLVKKN